MSAKSLTIKDIAQKAKVSISTVSRVMNGNTAVNPEVRDRVMKLVEELDYVPNINAVSMVKKKSNLIVIIVPHIFNPFFTTLIQKVEEEMKLHGYYTVVFSSNEDITEEKDFLNSTLGRTLDGIISVTAITDATFLRGIKKCMVLVDRYMDNCGLNSVLHDNYGGAYYATKRLLDAGHRKIGFINGPLDFDIGKDRIRGYHQAHMDMGVPIHEPYIKIGPWLMSTGYEAAMQMLQSNNPPTGILAASNFICEGCMQALSELNLRIKDDISLIGFEENETNIFERAGVSVIKLDTVGMGRLAAKMLLDSMNNSPEETPNMIRHIVLKTTYIERNSVNLYSGCLK